MQIKPLIKIAVANPLVKQVAAVVASKIVTDGLVQTLDQIIDDAAFRVAKFIVENNPTIGEDNGRQVRGSGLPV